MNFENRDINCDINLMITAKWLFNKRENINHITAKYLPTRGKAEAKNHC